MMAGVDIRPATPADAPVLSELAQASKAFWGYRSDLLELWRPQLTITPEFIEHLPVWVAVGPDAPLGFYALALEGGLAELEHLWVDPRCIGQDIGRALFEHALAQAQALGACELKVVSDPNAEGFYVRMGASRVGFSESVPVGRRLPVLALSLEGAR